MECGCRDVQMKNGISHDFSGDGIQGFTNCFTQIGYCPIPHEWIRGVCFYKGERQLLRNDTI